VLVAFQFITSDPTHVLSCMNSVL